MQQIWALNKEGKRKPVYIHGWVCPHMVCPWLQTNEQVYDLGTGLLKDLGVSQGPEALADAKATPNKGEDKN